MTDRPLYDALRRTACREIDGDITRERVDALVDANTDLRFRFLDVSAQERRSIVHDVLVSINESLYG